jgi:hypothetical protein
LKNKKIKKMEKIDFSPYAEIFWLEDINAIRVKWTKMYLSLDKFKASTDAVLEIITKTKSCIWIVDQFDSKGAFNKEVLDFITNELVATAVGEYGVKYVLTVMPSQSGMSLLSAKRWMGEVQKMDAFTMGNFGTLESCTDWIRANA